VLKLYRNRQEHDPRDLASERAMTTLLSSPALAAATVAELRQFHYGRASAPRPGLPEGILPAALHPLRGVAVRGGWPLLVDPDPASSLFARPLAAVLAAAADGSASRTLVDNLARVERRLIAALADGELVPAAERVTAAAAEVAAELDLGAGEQTAYDEGVAHVVAALPANAALAGFGPRASGALLRAAALRRLAGARARFAAEAQELAALADALLAIDRERRPAEIAADERAGKLGAAGAQLVDPARLGEVVSRRRTGEPLPLDRRVALEAARKRLAGFGDDASGPMLFAPERRAGRLLGAGARPVLDPCAEAESAFDAAAAELAGLVRAARRVRLEGAAAFDPERHPPALEALDWRAFTADELALVPPVLALVRAADLVAGQLPSLTRLLLSGKPVQVLLLASEEGQGEPPGGVRFEPAFLALAHREAYVQQGSVARPEALALAFARALEGTRPGVHVVDLPAAVAPHANGELDPWLVASARVSGRAAPLFRYEPEAGASWARRLRCDGNPEPATDWPAEPVPVEGEVEGEVAEAPAAYPFTFADAALLDPAWQTHFAPAPELDDELLPLADWLALPADEAQRKLPAIRACTREGAPLALVVTRALVQAARDRLAYWRTLAELAGVRSEHVEEAAARARTDAEARAARERAELEARHAAELARQRAELEAHAVDRVVAALFELGGEAPRPLPAAARSSAPASAELAPAPPATVAEISATVSEVARPPAMSPLADGPEEAWVDTPLCTSCDECVRKAPGAFVYNADKQAYVKDPRGASFRDLVLAAEACTARIIHPGTPWNPDEPDLDTWVARARALQAAESG
jgi:ferredoxin